MVENIFFIWITLFPDVVRIEETKNAEAAREREVFEAGKQDQINMEKYLQDIKEFEAQQVSL